MFRHATLGIVAAALAAGFMLALAGCSKDNGWSKVQDDNPELVAAREEARSTYEDEFLKFLKARKQGMIYNVEVLYEEGGKSEYLTLDVLSADKDQITGVILGYPNVVSKLNGEELTVPVSTLSDWSVYTPEGDSRGGFVSEVRARLQRAGTGG